MALGEKDDKINYDIPKTCHNILMTFASLPLSQRSLSLDHQELIRVLTEQENILIIQDLDGVCMGLVKDPLTRVIDRGYLEATENRRAVILVG